MIIDTNVTLSRWPFRRLPGDETPDLVARLRARGITQAWAGSFDGLLHRDTGGVNARLADECRRHGAGILIPFGSVNPKLPDWREDLRRCEEEYEMRGIRLHPNYHGYGLNDPEFAQLLEAAEARKLIVQVAVSMEDARTQHPLLRVPLVDPGPLLSRAPGVPVVLLNWWSALRGPKLAPLAALSNVFFDIATVEGIEGIARLVEPIPVERILFGSNAPLFTLDAALLKMRESGLPEERTVRIFEANARQLLTRQ